MTTISESNSLSSNSLNENSSEFENKYYILLEEFNKLKVDYQELKVKCEQLTIQIESSNLSNTSTDSNISVVVTNIPQTNHSDNSSDNSPISTPSSATSTPSASSPTPSSPLIIQESSKPGFIYTQSVTSPLSIGTVSLTMSVNTSPTPITPNNTPCPTPSSPPKELMTQSLNINSLSSYNNNANGVPISFSQSSSKEMLTSSGNSIGKKIKKLIHINGKSSKSIKDKPSKKDKGNIEDKDENSELSDFDYNSKVKGLSTLYRHIPELEVIPTSEKKSFLVLSGPDYQPSTEINQQTDVPMVKHPNSYGDSIYAVSTSTYPFLIGNDKREGDPIADRYTCSVYNNRLITVLADGCNWGERPKAAAQRASQAFMEYVMSKNDEISNVKDAGRILFEAFENAHKNIIDGKTAEDLWQLGTTTLLGGVLLEINKGQDKWTPQWEFVCASVGDCKAYLISPTEIQDITEGNRVNLDAKDCGGRLGPTLEQGKPDLRNLNIFCASAEPGDIIVMVSDGVHDNLDPHHLGRSPNEMSKEFNLHSDKWSDIDSPKAMVAKAAFQLNFLENLLQGTSVPQEIANRLLDHCWNITKSSRDFMETNPGKRLPNDYAKFPGKMDHTTCIVFKVGHFKEVSNSSSANGFVQNFGVAETPLKSMLSPQKDWIKGSPSTKYPTQGKKGQMLSNADDGSVGSTTPSSISNNSSPSSISNNSTPQNISYENSPVLISINNNNNNNNNNISNNNDNDVLNNNNNSEINNQNLNLY